MVLLTPAREVSGDVFRGVRKSHALTASMWRQGLDKAWLLLDWSSMFCLHKKRRIRCEPVPVWQEAHQADLMAGFPMRKGVHQSRDQETKLVAKWKQSGEHSEEEWEKE